MSLDLLLSILFVLAFIVLPLASRALRRGSRGGRGSPPGSSPAGGGGRQQADAPPWLAEAQRRVREAQARGGSGSSAEASAAPPERPLLADDRSGEGRQAAGDGSLVPEDPFGKGRLPAPPRDLVSEDPMGRPEVPPAEPMLVPEDPFKGGLAAEPGTDGSGATRAGGTLGREGAPVPQERTSPPPVAAGEVGSTPSARAGGKRRRRSRAGERGGAVAIGLVMAAYVRPRKEHGGARLRSVGPMRFDRRAVVNGLIWHEILDEPAWKRRQRRASSRPRSR